MILTTLLAAAALCGGPTPVLAPQNTTKETADGVEILRRILVESLDKAFAAETKEDHLLRSDRQGRGFPGMVTTLWASADTVEHARAFHMPEVGLFFAFDLSLPVVARDEKPAPGAAPAAPGDEWERMRRVMQGDEQEGVRAFTFQRFRVGTDVAAEIDPKAIEKVIDLALQTVARHANRIEGLTANDSATLTLRLSGRSRTLFEDFGSEEDGVEDTGEAGEGFRQGVERAARPVGEAGEALPSGAYSIMLSTGHEVREQHLVIRVPLADLTALAENPARLRQRAQINLY
jgi:hypothetical protein